MARPVLVMMDQVHLTLLVRRGLAKPEYAAIRRTLKSASFHAKLHRAIREVLHRYPSLSKVRT